MRCYVYVPHPTYPDTCMILDSQASEGDFAFLTHNPDVLVMHDCGTKEVTLLGEYTGKMFDVESVVKQLDAHYAEYARKPDKIELTTVLTR